MKKNKKIYDIILNIIILTMISAFAYSITPKTFQNDIFYTIKIGEHIEKTTETIADLLPWNKGLDMMDPFSWHENLPYTYPHWLYDLVTYKIYSIGGFSGIYYVTCILAIILGISIYLINKKFSKDKIVPFLIAIGTLYCLKPFITARAQLLTYIMFVFTIYGIEQFIKNKKKRYGLLLIAISTIIANSHCAVWPFFFVLFLPYLVEYFIYKIVSVNCAKKIKQIVLKFKYILKKVKKSEYDEQIEVIKASLKKYKENIDRKLNNTNKLKLAENKNIKWLIIIIVICAFTGLLSPIKDTPYTYLIKTSEGNTTQNISEHLPLILINNENMITILLIILGILIFSRVKISVRDIFMLFGLIAMAFMSKRHVALLVVIGNFIVVRLICELFYNIRKYFKCIGEVSQKNKILLKITTTLAISSFVAVFSLQGYIDKKNEVFVDEHSYPVAAAEWINNELIPSVGIENLKMYNDYNYGSYLLFKDIPVFIDSRADLYTPEFYGEKDEEGNYIGNDIFSDFLDISSLATSYEDQFEKYGVTHVMTTSNSKLNSIIMKDSNYNLLYEDDSFVIYELKNIDNQG